MKTFTITVTMQERWIPPFLNMLRYMQYLGSIGSSRVVAIYSDGDGDFQPKFEWDDSPPCKHITLDDNEQVKDYHIFDAG